MNYDKSPVYPHRNEVALYKTVWAERIYKPDSDTSWAICYDLFDLMLILLNNLHYHREVE